VPPIPMGRLPTGDVYMRWQHTPEYAPDWRQAIDSDARSSIARWLKFRRLSQESGEWESCLTEFSRQWILDGFLFASDSSAEHAIDRVLSDLACDSSIVVSTSPRSRELDPSSRRQCSLLLKTLADERTPIAVEHITEIHRVICGPIESNALLGTRDAAFEQISPGKMRPYPAFVLGNDRVFKECCSPENIRAETSKVLRALALAPDSPEDSPALGAWLHTSLCVIHPFLDGNGRVARALASLVLARAGLLPMLIPRDQRERYMAAVSRIHFGECAPIVSCICGWQKAAIESALRRVETRS
jgi:hypothetical protein